MRKKRISGIVLIFISVMFFSGCYGKSAGDGNTGKAARQESLVDTVTRRGVLKVGLSTFVPWAMKDKNGNLVGFEVDVAKRLAKDMGVETEERKISIDEVMSETAECFVTGTAAGVGYIESITNNGSTAVFNNGEMGELSRSLLKTLKGIQYGKAEDKFNWMF